MSASHQSATLVVQRLDRAAAISVTTDLPRKCLVFGDDGAIQAIDATGVVRNLASSSGSLIPTDDDADFLGAVDKRWRGGYFGTVGVMTPQLTTLASGAAALVAKLSNSGTAVNYFNLTNAPHLSDVSIAAEGTSNDIGIVMTPKGTGTVQVGAGGLQAATIQGQTISLGGLANITLSGSSQTITAATPITFSLGGAGGGVTFNSSLGTIRIGTGAGLRLGFFTSTGVVQQALANITPAVDGTTAGTALNSLLGILRLYGLLA